MATTKTKTERPLSARIEEHEAEADRLAAEVRAERDRATRLEQEKAERELQARQTWSEGQLGRLREIYRVADEARKTAVAAFKTGQADAHALWVAWRAAERSAVDEWSVIATVYEQSHPGQFAPKGRTFIGGGPGKSGERWQDFAHRLAVEVANEAGAATRQRVLADLAAVVGSTDLAALETSVTPVARFYRGRPEGRDHHGDPTGDIVAWPGRHPGQPVKFDASGYVDVYDEDIAQALDADPACARVPVGSEE